MDEEILQPKTEKGRYMKVQRIRSTTITGVLAVVVAAGLFTAPSGQAASTIKIGYINATIGNFAGPAPEITKGMKIALNEAG
jgi:hypothetical protein